ncbi:metallopeptidase family protein [Actomonas aquatica]|uniref:Metallopeptidase family protein n=1 Tax=Actomonas aquatica TaxID=2866162 RepID=A0ABZ1C4W8_9BACT|nr:metallopeptidase family protein [Opitutus sp. WL0086]WRQ86392.1 metallopeptidase family protein [Opitutus sp. WL0086]
MSPAQLRTLAAEEVAATLADLPPELRPHVDRIPVLYHDRPSAEILGAEFEPDILGLFVGPPHGEDTGDRNDMPTQILLFLGNLWDFAEHDREIFLDEVHVTFLHELGHYFGWDEDDLAERELD